MPSVIDSSGWIEYFTNGPNASAFEKPILATEDLIVPSITIFEVYRWVLREVGEKEALAVTSAMRQGTVVSLDAALATTAADQSHRKKLPMADGIIWTTGKQYGATIYTQDADLDGLDSVVYIRHPKKI
jgi:predicted nucleic acid-binding protein